MPRPNLAKALSAGALADVLADLRLDAKIWAEYLGRLITAAEAKTTMRPRTALRTEGFKTLPITDQARIVGLWCPKRH